MRLSHEGKLVSPGLDARFLLNVFTALLLVSFAGDIANGLVGTAETGVTVGKALRGGILIFAALYLLLSLDAIPAIALLLATSYVVLSILLGLMTVHSLDFALEAVQAARILYTPIVSIFLIELMRRHYSGCYFADSLFVRASIIGLLIAVSVIVPAILGIGQGTYGAMASFGSKGILLSQNEIGLTLIMLQVLAAYHLSVGRLWFGAALVCVNGVALLLLGTRTAVVGSFFVPLIAFFGITLATSAFGHRSVRGALGPSLVILSMTVAAAIVAIPLILSDAYLTAKFAQLLITLNVRGGLMEAGREVLTSGSALQLLFGQSATEFYGAVGSSELVTVGNTFGKRVEVDWIDVWGIYGLVGVVCIYFFYFGSMARHAIRIGDPIHASSAMILFLFIGHSLWAGHAVMAPMPGTIAAIVIALSAVRASNDNGSSEFGPVFDRNQKE